MKSFCTSILTNQGCGSGKFFVEAEAGSGKNGTASALAIHIKRDKLECGANFCEIYDEK